jgi:hypothetical protein
MNQRNQGLTPTTEDQKVSAVLIVLSLGLLLFCPISLLPENLLIPFAACAFVALLAALIYKDVSGPSIRRRHPRIWNTLLGIYKTVESFRFPAEIEDACSVANKFLGHFLGRTVSVLWVIIKVFFFGIWLIVKLAFWGVVVYLAWIASKAIADRIGWPLTIVFLCFGFIQWELWVEVSDLRNQLNRYRAYETNAEHE